MGYVQLFLAIFTLTREIMRYLNNLEEAKQGAKGKAKKMKDFKNALKKANKERDTDELETIFSDLVSGVKRSVSDKG